MDNLGMTVSDVLRARALESDRCIVEAAVGLRKLSMVVGWEGAFLKRHSLWPALGYINELEYRIARGIGRSTWYRAVGAAERLQKLTKDEFLELTLENAELLAACHESERYDDVILEKAKTLTQSQLRNTIAIEQSIRQNKSLKETWTNLDYRVSEAQRMVIERALNDWQKEHSLDSPAQALELLVVEYSNRPTLVGFISEAIVRLSKDVLAAKTEKELKALQALFADHIREMGEILQVCKEGEMVA